LAVKWSPKATLLLADSGAVSGTGGKLAGAGRGVGHGNESA
jgi:hypothetical protein